MLGYAARRLLQMVVVLLGVTFVMFLIRSPAIVPGDPVRMIVGERYATDQIRQAVTDEYGLDSALPVQYYRYMEGLLHGDLGESYQLRRPVRDILLEKLPNTLSLVSLAFLVEVVLGLTAGVLAAVKRGSFWDSLMTVSTAVVVAVPVFWLGTLLQQVFAIKFREWGLWHLPASGISSDGRSFWLHVILPALTLASVTTAYAARITRSQLVDVMGQDYIRAAFAKGLRTRHVVLRHGMKNAMLPVVTYLGVGLGGLLGGAILTEAVFSWPGMGYAVYQAVMERDWPVVTGGLLVVATAIMLINLAVDLTYAYLDPRVRHGGGPA